jgi:8-oxo-dGTP diphosphatase
VNIRYAAHAICLDAGSVLLTQFGDGDVNPGSWTLPGGGLEWREPPDQGVLRKLYEETGLHGRVQSVLGVDTEVHPAWSGRSALHSVRFIFRVDAHGPPHVVDRDGSAVDCRWFPYEQLVDLPIVPLVPRALGMV